MNEELNKLDELNPVSVLVGERIKTARLEKHWTLEQLAKATGYKSKAGINAIEKGTRDLSVPKLMTFAKALDKPIDYFINNIQNETLEAQVPDFAMEPLINRGDIVIYSSEQTLCDGDIVIIKDQYGISCRKLEVEKVEIYDTQNVYYYLKPISKKYDIYKSELIPPDNLNYNSWFENIVILGKVMYVKRKVEYVQTHEWDPFPYDK